MNNYQKVLKTIKLVKQINDSKVQDSPASQIVEEIRRAYPQVKVQQYAMNRADYHSTRLTFSNYPGEGATGFGNDPRTDKRDKWEKFLKHIVAKYIPDYENTTIIDDKSIIILSPLKKDSVKDAGNDWYKHYFRLQKTRNSYDEYVVKEYVNGKFREEGSYYTDDWEDAVGTMKDIARRLGMQVKEEQGGRVLMAVKDSVNDAFTNFTPRSNALYNFCRRYQFYTAGDVRAYENLLNNADKWSLDDIAKDILEHSDYKILSDLGIYSVRNMMDFISKNTIVKDANVDDGVSPMTYAKLKELGYTSEDWKDWSDEEKVKKSQESKKQQGEKSSEKKEESSKESNKSEEESNYKIEHTSNGVAVTMSNGEMHYFRNEDIVKEYIKRTNAVRKNLPKAKSRDIEDFMKWYQQVEFTRPGNEDGWDANKNYYRSMFRKLLENGSTTTNTFPNCNLALYIEGLRKLGCDVKEVQGREYMSGYPEKRLKITLKDSQNAFDAKYTFEYDHHIYDYKTREDDVIRKSRTIDGMSAYDAAKQLPDDIEIIRVYKDNKLLKSFTSNSQGQWHGRGSKEALKDLD